MSIMLNKVIGIFLKKAVILFFLFLGNVKAEDSIEFDHCKFDSSESITLAEKGDDSDIYYLDEIKEFMTVSYYIAPTPEAVNSVEIIETLYVNGFYIEHYSFKNTVWGNFFLIHDNEKQILINTIDKNFVVKLANLCN